MMHCLELHNYRGFQNYKLSDLSRVNLLVGKNNSGKTSVLEAINLLESNGDLHELATLARQRGEVIPYSSPSGPRKRMYPDVSHFFYGHSFEQGSSFLLRSDGEAGEITVRVVSLADAPDAKQLYLFDEDLVGSTLGIKTERRNLGEAAIRPTHAVPISEEGAVWFDRISPYGRVNRTKAEDRPVQFVPQDSLDRNIMIEMWDRVITEGREQDVVEAMRILDPRVTSIVFLSSDRSSSLGTRAGILIGFEGDKRRYPLGSYGEGMRRILALALSLARAKNGVLLIDEIDTGLHYSVLGDVWLLIVEAAKRYNIQVFATTHSLDCLRGLARLCQTRSDLGTEVSLQKIERDLYEAVALNAEQIQIAVEQEIEVR